MMRYVVSRYNRRSLRFDQDLTFESKEEFRVWEYSLNDKGYWGQYIEGNDTKWTMEKERGWYVYHVWVQEVTEPEEGIYEDIFNFMWSINHNQEIVISVMGEDIFYYNPVDDWIDCNICKNITVYDVFDFLDEVRLEEDLHSASMSPECRVYEGGHLVETYKI